MEKVWSNLARSFKGIFKSVIYYLEFSNKNKAGKKYWITPAEQYYQKRTTEKMTNELEK